MSQASSQVGKWVSPMKQAVKADMSGRQHAGTEVERRPNQHGRTDRMKHRLVNESLFCRGGWTGITHPLQYPGREGQNVL